MKIYVLFTFILLNYSFQETEPLVVNSCGNKEYKTTNSMPKKKEDCKDDDEPACKLVNVTKNNIEKRFCAIIHGKYNDKDVIKEVEDLINAKITVEGKGFNSRVEYLLLLLCISMLF